MTDILVIAAHPDDAELAVGGVIAQASASDQKVVIVNFTVSEVNQETRIQRIRSAEKASVILEAELVWALDGAFDQVEDIKEYACIREIDRLVEHYKPRIVLSHTDEDSHADHVRLARAVIASSRRWDADIYAFQPNEFRTQVYGSFRPNVITDISPFMDKKLAAIECYNYGSNNFRALNGDMIKNLNANLGMLNGFSFAEGLKLIRKRGSILKG